MFALLREAKSYCLRTELKVCKSLLWKWCLNRSEWMSQPSVLRFPGRGERCRTPVQGDGRNKAAQQWHGSRDRNTILLHTCLISLENCRWEAEKDVLLQVRCPWHDHGIYLWRRQRLGWRCSLGGTYWTQLLARVGREGQPAGAQKDTKQLGGQDRP